VNASFSLSNLSVSQVSLAASSNTSVFGAAVQLTATVTPAAAAGKVTFYVAWPFGGQALSSGTVTLLPLLGIAGKRSLSARYVGDSNYAGASSNSVSHIVSAVASPCLAPKNAQAVEQNLAPLVMADFNHDGKLDLATASGNGLVATLLGNGDGTFQSPAYIPQVANPFNVVAGDFNGDGFPDLAVTTS
jgi:hypothetical protein